MFDEREIGALSRSRGERNAKQQRCSGHTQRPRQME
jgi:hypothetical protein